MILFWQNYYMKQLERFKVILWDFDGVILDSMPIRDLGFVKVLEREGFHKSQINLLIEYHRLNGGLSRYVKFRYFYEQILNRPITEQEILRLSNLFSEIMLTLLIDENLLISDSFEFIKSNHKKYRFHIVSGSDGVELNEICTSLNLSPYFKSIQGSPKPKKQLVHDLIVLNNYDKKDICLIGDSINDFEASYHNDISFFGYNNLELKRQGNYINHFKEL